MSLDAVDAQRAAAPARKTQIDLPGGAMLVLFTLILGLNQSLVRLVNEGFSPVFQAGLRSVFALPVVLLIAWALRRRLSLGGGTFWPGMLAGVFFTAEFTLMFLAVELTAVSRTAVLFYTMPFWVAAGAHFLIPGERLTRRRLIGLALAVFGVSIAFTERSADAGPHQLWGDLMCLAAAACWAGIALVTRASRLERASPEMQLIYQLAFSAVALTAIAPLFGAPIREPSLEIYGIFAFQVLAVVCFGYLSWFWMLSIYPASDVASFSFLTPVFGVLFGWMILGESLAWNVLASLVLIGLGIFLVNYKPAPQRV